MDVMNSALMAPSVPNDWFKVRRLINDPETLAALKTSADSTARSTYLAINIHKNFVKISSIPDPGRQ